MRINVIKDKLNIDPDEVMNVSRKRFFEIFFRIFQVNKNRTLSTNEIELLSCLCADLPISISKNNQYPVIKKLNEKGLMVDNELSDICKLYKERFKDEVSIVMNFKITADEG